MNQPKTIIIHHTAVSRTKNAFQFNAIDNYHKSKGWNGIGYHYLVEANGLLLQGREELAEGAHCYQKGMNKESIGICLTGNFDIEEPTKEQIDTLKNLIKHLRIKYKISRDNVKFHREYAPKTCPGKLIADDFKNKIMPMLELFRDKKGGFWFCKAGDNGKQPIETTNKGVAGLLTVISREFGVDQIGDKELKGLDNKVYF